MASEDFALKTFLIFHIISQTNPGCGLIKDIIFNLILLFKIVSFFLPQLEYPIFSNNYRRGISKFVFLPPYQSSV